MTTLKQGIKKVGSQAKFAAAIGTSQQLVSYWVRVGKPLPIEFVAKAEKATGIPCHEWRPDFFPAPSREQVA